MSRRQTRPPGSTTVRRDTVRRKVAEKTWDQQREFKDALDDVVIGLARARFKPAPAKTVEKFAEITRLRSSLLFHPLGRAATEAGLRSPKRMPAGGIALDLAVLADQYDDPVLREAVKRLKAYGLGGKDWRDVVKADLGIMADPLVALAVKSVEDLIDRGHKPVEAYELVAADMAIESQSHEGALQFVKRAHERWRDTPRAERVPIARKRRTRKA